MEYLKIKNVKIMKTGKVKKTKMKIQPLHLCDLCDEDKFKQSLLISKIWTSLKTV